MTLFLIILLIITTVAVFVVTINNHMLVANFNSEADIISVKKKDNTAMLFKPYKRYEKRAMTSPKKVLSSIKEKGSRFSKRHVIKAHSRLQQHIQTLAYLSKLELYYESIGREKQYSTKPLEDFQEIRYQVRKKILHAIRNISSKDV